MTEAEQRLADDKVRAEIAHLNAQTAKLIRENVYYPLVVGSGVTLAIVAVAKVLL